MGPAAAAAGSDLTRMTREPKLDPGPISIGLRGIQEGTHPLVLDGRERTLVVEEEGERLLREFLFEGTLTFDGKDYRVRGFLNGTLEIACDRCLARFDRPFRAEVDARAVPQDAPVDESEGDDAGAGPFRLNADLELDLGAVLREAALLEVPIKNLCRSDCLGICPVCGVDRNLESCDCRTSESDPRWEALRGLSQPSDPKE